MPFGQETCFFKDHSVVWESSHDFPPYIYSTKYSDEYYDIYTGHVDKYYHLVTITANPVVPTRTGRSTFSNYNS